MAFNTLERRALFGLAILYATRMLGLFMVFPILSLYGQDLTGATATTLGFALGVYGLTQALLQIPFGFASDRFGRKPLMVIGLLIFLVGSVVAALADSVMGVTLGRALQGAGAISSVVLALLADYTREEQRSKAMAIIGVTIGLSFVLAVMLGPWVASFVGLAGVFWLTAGLAGLGLIIVLWLPTPEQTSQTNERKVKLSAISEAFGQPSVRALSSGVFVLHMSMTALFVALPVTLVERGFSADDLGAFYAPVILLSFVFMAPMLRVIEKKQKHLIGLLMAVGFMCFALAALLMGHSTLALAAALCLFFVGFNFMEATLPSLLSRRVSVDIRGTAMGVFSTGQFLGAAVGGLLGGLLFAKLGFLGVALLGVLSLMIWSVLTRNTASLKQPAS